MRRFAMIYRSYVAPTTAALSGFTAWTQSYKKTCSAVLVKPRETSGIQSAELSVSTRKLNEKETDIDDTDLNFEQAIDPTSEEIDDLIPDQTDLDEMSEETDPDLNDDESIGDWDGESISRLAPSESTTDLLDELLKLDMAEISHAEFIEFIKDLEEVLILYPIEQGVREHDAWNRLSDLFESMKRNMSLKEVSVMLSIVSLMKGYPPDIRDSLFALLSESESGLAEANIKTLRWIVKSLSRMRWLWPATVSRQIHTRLIEDRDQLPANDVVVFFRDLYKLKPSPTRGMTSLMYETISDNFQNLGENYLIVLCEIMEKTNPRPPIKLQNLVYNRCLNFDDDISPALLIKWLKWMSSCNYSTTTLFRQRIDSILLRTIVSVRFRQFRQLLLTYTTSNIEKSPVVIKAMINKYLNNPKTQSVQSSSRLLIGLKKTDSVSFEQIKQLCDAAGRSDLEDASMPDLVLYLSAMAQLGASHRLTKDVFERLVSCPRLSTRLMVRLVLSCARLIRSERLRMKLIYPLVTRSIDFLKLDNMKLGMLVMFADGLTKIGYSNRAMAEKLFIAFQRHLNEMNLFDLIKATKALLFVWNTESGLVLLERLTSMLESGFDDITPMDTAFAVHIVGLLGRNSGVKFKILLTKLVFKHAESFAGFHLYQIFRHGSYSSFMSKEMALTLTQRAIEVKTSISGRHMSYILSGLIQSTHYPTRTDFDLLSANIANHLKDLDLTSLRRYVSALAAMSYADPAQLDIVADRICESDIETYGLMLPASLLFFLAKLNYSNDKLREWLQQKINAESIERASFETFSNLIFAFQRFDVKPFDGFLEEVLGRTAGKLNKLKNFDFGVIMSGLVHYGCELPQEYVDEAGAYLEERVSRFKSDSACYAIYSLVKAGYRPSTDCIDTISRMVAGKSNTRDPQHIARFLYACGQSRYRPLILLSRMEYVVMHVAESLNPSTASELVWGLSVCGWRDIEGLRALAFGSYDRMESMSATEFSEFVWGLAHAGFSESRFYTKAAEVAHTKQESMNNRDLLLTIWAFARASKPASLFIEQAMSRLPTEISKYTNDQLSSLAWALSKIDLYDSAVVTALEEAVLAQLTTLTITAFASVLYAFASLRHYPSSLNQMLDEVSKRSDKMFSLWISPMQLLWACSRFNKPPPANVLSALEAKIANLPSFWKAGSVENQPNNELSHVVLSLWCLYCLGLHTSFAAITAENRLNELDVLEALTPENKEQIAECLLFCSTIQYSSPLQQIPEHYRENIMSSWKEAVNQRATSEPSTFSKQIAAGFRQLGIPYKTDAIIYDGTLLVDFSFEDSKQKPKALMLCSEEEIFRNVNIVTGRMQFRFDILKNIGVDVIMLPITDWQKIVDQEGEKDGLLTLLAGNGLHFDIKPSQTDTAEAEGTISSTKAIE